jgi:hypothetical protein
MPRRSTRLFLNFSLALIFHSLARICRCLHSIAIATVTVLEAFARLSIDVQRYISLKLKDAGNNEMENVKSGGEMKGIN